MPETSAPVAEMTASELFDSLNRFDEIAIARAFGEDIYTLQQKPFDFLRCLVFTDQRRGGMKDDAAQEYAFTATIGQLQAYFAADIARARESQAGKGVTPSS